MGHSLAAGAVRHNVIVHAEITEGTLQAGLDPT
jgi:hypothetical protein